METEKYIIYHNLLFIQAHYIKDHGLAGAMIWSLDTDDFSGFCVTPNQDPVRVEENIDVVKMGNETGKGGQKVEDGWIGEDVRRQEDRGLEEVESRLEGEDGRKYVDRVFNEMNSLKERHNIGRVDSMLEEDDSRNQILDRRTGKLNRVVGEEDISIQDLQRILRVNRVVKEGSRRKRDLDGRIAEYQRIQVHTGGGIQDEQETNRKVRFPIITTISTILRNGRPIPTPSPAPIPAPTTTTTVRFYGRHIIV